MDMAWVVWGMVGDEADWLANLRVLAIMCAVCYIPIVAWVLYRGFGPASDEDEVAVGMVQMVGDGEQKVMVIRQGSGDDDDDDDDDDDEGFDSDGEWRKREKVVVVGESKCGRGDGGSGDVPPPPPPPHPPVEDTKQSVTEQKPRKRQSTKK